jgi:ElaB/YqjD/DUF883 family membrane-anchored ribosome-binding protein
METSTRGAFPSNSGMTNNDESFLTRTSSNAHAAVNSMAGAADEAARKVKPAIDHVASMAHHALDKAADVVSEQGENLSATTRKLAADTAHYVAVHPVKTIAIAVAAGFLLSRLVL